MMIIEVFDMMNIYWFDDSNDMDDDVIEIN